MEQRVTRRGLIRIAVLAIVLILCLIAYYPFSPGGKQARKVRKAKKHDELLNKQLLMDPRFQQVTVYTWVGESIVLEVEGEVKSWADGQTLVDLVWDSAPPVPVRWAVSLPMTSMVEGVSLTGSHDEVEVRGLTNPAK